MVTRLLKEGKIVFSLQSSMEKREERAYRNCMVLIFRSEYEVNLTSFWSSSNYSNLHFVNRT